MALLHINGMLLVILLLTFYRSTSSAALVDTKQTLSSIHERNILRQKRSLPADQENEDIEKKIKQMVREDIEKLVEQLVNEKLEISLKKLKNNLQCLCPDTKGERGPQGPRGIQGPPGPPGERGLGLHPPRLTHKILNPTTAAGESVQLSCKFFGNPVPTTHWENVPNKAHVQTKIDKQRSEIETTLSMENVIWEDHGKYTCHASNLFKNVSGTGFLTVLTPPMLRLPRQPLIGILGMTMDFPECVVVSVPHYNVTWERGFLPFPALRTNKDNGTLRIRSLRVEDEGYYKCVASNYLGTTTEIVHLRVKPLQFSRRPKFYEYVSNGSKTLTCSAQGPVNKLSGAWYDLTNGQRLLMSRTFQKDNEFSVSILLKDSGRYRCEISNGITKVESSTEVDMLHLNSTILNSSNIHSLGRWLKDVNQIGRYELCWSTAREGFNHSVFYNRCARKPNTLSLFENNQGELFGGFTDSMWSSGRSLVKFINRRVVTGCGAVINGNSEIRYTGQARSGCSWFINTKTPVMISIKEFNYPCYNGCSRRFEIKSDGKTVGRYCNKNKPASVFSNRGTISLKMEPTCRSYRYHNMKFTIMIMEMDYGFSSQSFLFSFSPKAIKIPIKRSDQAICHLHGYEPCFGKNELRYHNGTVSVDIGKAYIFPVKNKSNKNSSFNQYPMPLRNGSGNQDQWSRLQDSGSVDILNGVHNVSRAEVYYKVK